LRLLPAQPGDFLVNDSESLADLVEQHRVLEHSLEQLAARRTLTPSEQREVARLKKQKLLTKDRITRLSSAASAAIGS
jgi:uncharacterized protein YdcH (DUF465 family)